MSTLDEWEHHRRYCRSTRGAATKRADKRRAKSQMRLFADPPKKPALSEAAPFDDFDRLPF